ncbi:MAG: VOC family protein [Halobacteriales archaeon]|nr:VOC family protein [Halobacteriales archaeon]
MEVVDIDHVALRVTDLEKALGFYADTLGMEVRDSERYESGGTPFVAVVAGGRHVHLVPTEEDEIDVGGEHVCFLVRSSEKDTRDEVETLIERVEDAGYDVEDGEPHLRYGAYGYDHAVYVRDPDGRRVELKLH